MFSHTTENLIIPAVLLVAVKVVKDIEKLDTTALIWADSPPPP
jgi:hypothetical protein